MPRSYALLPLVVAAFSGTCMAANEFRYQIKVGTGSWSTAVDFDANTAQTINVGTVGSSDVYLRIFDKEPILLDGLGNPVLDGMGNPIPTLDDLGRITIVGTSGVGSGRLKIAVWRDFTPNFPSNPQPDLLIGAASWAGLSFNDPGSSNNTNVDLLKRTDLAASIRDNLTGNVDVGRVFTMQVNGTLQGDGSVVGGNIDGRVRAWEEDVYAPGALFDDAPTLASIEYVRAGNRITQTVVAGDTNNTAQGYVGSGFTTIEEQLQEQRDSGIKMYLNGTWVGRGASIRRVVIGPSTKAEGIIADQSVTFGGLEAKTGRIYRVTTTGPIGDITVGNKPQIVAGFGVYSVRMTDESGSQVVNPTYGNDWNLTLTANYYMGPSGGYYIPGHNFYAGVTLATGAINLVETTGDVIGPITAANLTNVGPEASTGDAFGHSGIISGGAVSGVTVGYHVHYANIIGDSVDSVSIGQSLVGAMVAYGTGGGPGTTLAASGEIVAVFVATTPVDPWNDPYPWMAHGFIGCDVAPLDMSPSLSGDPTSGTTAWGYDADRWLYRSGGDTGCNGSPSAGAAVDSVIRAEARIWKSGIGFMTQRLGKCSPSDEEGRIAAYRPRVEAPVIQDSSVGVMEAGVVWSGRLNYSSGVLANLREDDYTLRAEGSTFHTIGPAADLWWKSILGIYPFDADLQITGDPADASLGYGHGGVLGELHVPTLPTSAYILVEGGIGDTGDADAIGLHYDPITSTEDSPRGRRLLSAAPGDVEPSYVPAGIITVDSSKGTTFSSQDGGLNGQIVLRAVPEWMSFRVGRDDYWKGQVRIGDAFAVSPAVVVLDPAANTPPLDHQQYEYAAKATMLGLDTSGTDNGGAVGVASYELHASDCIPPTKGSFATPPALADVQPSVATAGVWSQTIRTRFYGPVFDASSDAAAVSIESSASGTFTTDRVSETGSFTVSVVSGTSVGAQQDRDVLITGTCTTYDPTVIYRVVRAQDSVDEEAAGQLMGYWPGTWSGAEDVQPFAHYFRIACNIADIGKAGGLPGPEGYLDNNDFIVFIDFFFNHDPRADMGIAGGLPGSDGLFDNNDFIAFIDWFFQDNCNGTVNGPCGLRGTGEGGGG